MTNAVNGKAVLHLPRLVARVDRLMAAAVTVQAVLVLADFLLLGLLAGGVALLEGACLAVFGIVGPAIGVTRHFRVAARDGAGLVLASAAGSLVLGVLFHFALGGPASLRVVVHSGASVARLFEVSVTLQVAASAAALLVAVLALRRRTSILSLGRLPG